jgi:hypothetical protein
MTLGLSQEGAYAIRVRVLNMEDMSSDGTWHPDNVETGTRARRTLLP